MSDKKTKAQFFGKEGFLDTSKEVNYGLRSQYVKGIDNNKDNSVYDGLIADFKERERKAKAQTKT